MGDLISRAWVLAEYDRQHQGPPGGARKIVAEAPDVDAVPVVRCKDCKYFTLDAKLKDYGDCERLDDGEYGFVTKLDWYCADGERREADG